MTFLESTKHNHPHNLDNNLIVRPSSQADTEALLQLVDSVFGTMMEEAGGTHMTHLVQRVMSGTHPSMRPDDFTVVEDTRRTERQIVGCTGLLHHTWQYERIPFSVGRPEVIATYPEYRHQGLIRALFAMMHARSQAQGHHLQAITGIPYFYRLFDYEYALELWNTCTIDAGRLPEAIHNPSGTYTLRDATLKDIPLIQKLYKEQRHKGMISQIVDERWWLHQIQTWQHATPQQNINSHVQMIECTEMVKGYVITSAPQVKRYMQIWDLQLVDDGDLQEAMPAILHELAASGAQERASLQQNTSFNELRFMLGRTHLAFSMLDKMRKNIYQNQYAWYIRVADLPQFLAHIAPALDLRLADAGMGTFSGELKLDFYSSGLRLVFEHGHLKTTEAWQQQSGNYVKADAGFPPNVFLQLLFGRRSLAELTYILPDVWVKDARVGSLLQILFPTKPSWILPLW